MAVIFDLFDFWSRSSAMILIFDLDQIFGDLQQLWFKDSLRKPLKQRHKDEVIMSTEAKNSSPHLTSHSVIVLPFSVARCNAALKPG